MTRFDKDELVGACLTAVRSEADPRRAVKEIDERAVSDPTSIEAEVRPRTESPMMTVWHRSDELTVLHIVWPPDVDLFAHDHGTAIAEKNAARSNPVRTVVYEGSQGPLWPGKFCYRPFVQAILG